MTIRTQPTRNQPVPLRLLPAAISIIKNPIAGSPVSHIRLHQNQRLIRKLRASRSAGRPVSATACDQLSGR
ncbi:hypothetical protein D3C87_1910080 [compost metagenome]